ncbi:MAG: hypothetical protein IT379_28595 [Deltaproteobacteria bacterium]|nr:hypothetical protein [Deltaproteobacteria bacterium]
MTHSRLGRAGSTARACALAASIVLPYGIARAQDPSATAAPPSAPTTSATALPSRSAQTVRLRNGTVLRGTVAELVPDDRIVIVLATGETRRIPMDEVARVENDESPGSLVRDAASRPGPRPVTRRPVSLRFAAAQPGLSLHWVTSTLAGYAARYGSRWAMLAQYERLCTAPCELTVSPGTYDLALSQGAPPVALPGPTRIPGPGTLRGTYVSHEGRRTVGLVTAIGSPILGAIVAVTGFAISVGACGGEPECSPSGAGLGMFVGGVSLGIVGAAVGLVLILTGGDDVALSFEPRRSATARARQLR